MSIETHHPSPEDLTQTIPERPPEAQSAPETEATPPDVADALRRGEAQEREEARGEMSPEREDELNLRLTALVTKHPELGVGDPLEFIRKNAKAAELMIKGLEFKVARDAFNEMYKRWYKANDEERGQMGDEHKTKSHEYEQARAEYVGESATYILRERIRRTDKAAEEKTEKRSWLGKVYDAWKDLGELNLDRALSGTRFAPTGKIGKFVARFASVRTAISAGLLGAGVGLGAGSAVGIGAIALRRVFAGLGSGIGSYDLLRNATDKWSRTFGWRKEVTEEEARAMPIEEIAERLEHLEAWARLNGKKISETPTYQILFDQYRRGILETSLIAELETGKNTIELIESELAAAGEGIEARIAKLKIDDATMKLIGASIGIVTGSVVAITKGIEAYFGKVEAPPNPFNSHIIIHGSGGEAAALNPDGTMQYAPPHEGAPPVPEAPTPVSLPEIIIKTHRGDNVWKMTTRALHEKFGERFDSLDAARKSYLIDSVKDQLAEDPKSWGKIDLVKVGDQFNFTRLFNDPRMESLVRAAEELSPEKVKSILEHQEALRDFLREHPGYKLRPGDVDRIIRGELTDANYEAGLGGGEEAKLEVIERPPVLPTTPVAAEAPTAARLDLRFAPGLSAQEQEVIAKQVDYYRDKAEALGEKAAILEKFYGQHPHFGEFKTELNDEIARLENQANGLVADAERMEDVAAMKRAVKYIGREVYTPYADATVQARATGVKFGIIPNEVASYDIYVDAKEATHDAIRNQNFLAAGVEIPKGHFAEGFVRDATGQKLAHFEYSPTGEPQSVVYAGRPDLKAAKACLAADWDKAPSSLEKSKILNRALSLERYNSALRELSRAGLLRSPEANFLKKAIGVVKKALGPTLRPEFRI